MPDQKSSDPIVITGVGLGLPDPSRPIFNDDNIELLLKGRNFISSVGENKIDFQKRQNIIQKSKHNGEVIFKNLSEKDDLVKLAGEAGTFDLVEEFKVGKGLIDAWEITTRLAIAAGLEALKDAKIPLKLQKGKLSLPDEMVDTTGIIFASTFPAANTFLEEQRKFYTYSQRLEKERIVSTLQEKLGEDVEEIIKEAVFLDEEEEYQFDRKYLLKAIPIQSGNFAQVINARGPNTGINAACASTTQAIAMAEDWIRLGRCDRVIVVAADDPTNDETFHWIATGFLAAGAATTEENVNTAARPFDQQRSGMILGMGAVGIVVEKEEETKKRGIHPIVELLGSHFANSAFHGTRMNPDHVNSSFEKFMNRMVEKYDLDLEEVAASCLYMSHETFTPPKGNGAKTEIQSLQRVFGTASSKIIVSNTKGMTAHSMGVAIEDAAAIKALEYGLIPPVANLQIPEFSDIRFSKGEMIKVRYAIRFAAGFGSQLVYLLFRNVFTGHRVTDEYHIWLESSYGCTETKLHGRTLVIEENQPLS